MKIQCQVCEAAEANVMCCADEAALCWPCDEKVHAANKLASKHQRVPLSTSSSSSQTPKCDICQEAVGHFFCLEDRALLCRNCDVAIHTVNSFVSAHQRFLLTGVKVSLEPAEPGPSSSVGKLNPGVKNSQPCTQTVSPVSVASQQNGGFPVQDGAVGALPFSGGAIAGSMSQWQFDDFLGMMDFNQNDGYGSPETISGKLVDSDCSPILRADEFELDMDECLGQVPESSWMVPEIPSPPTASGLHWQSDSAAFVPDITCSPVSNGIRYRPRGGILKRQRQF